MCAFSYACSHCAKTLNKLLESLEFAKYSLCIAILGSILASVFFCLPLTLTSQVRGLGLYT